MRRFMAFAAGTLLMLLLPVLLFGGVTGKIAGRVIDRETGKPLPFANLLVVGTGWGAVSDMDGYYHILNVPPGNYSVEARMMGYASLTKTGVEVISDLTKTVNFELTTEVIDIDTLVIYGDPIIPKDVTGTMQVVTGEEMEYRVAEDFTDVMMSATGAVKDPQAGEIHVRGGRGGEVLYMVDGMPVTDPLLGGGLGLRIATNAIEEMSVMAGGFEAEYGQAQSGVVNLVTREGGAKKHSGNISYKTDHPLGDAGLQSVDSLLNKFYGWEGGPKAFSFNEDWVEFSLGGPEPVSSSLLPLLGFNAPGELTYFFSGWTKWTDTYTPYTLWYHSPFSPKPVEVDRGGIYDSLNILGDAYPDQGMVTLADLLFNNSTWGTGVELMPKRQRNIYSINTKLAYNISQDPRMKLTGGYRKSWAWRHEYSHSYKYAAQNAYLRRENDYQWNLDWTHTLKGGNTYYNVRLGKFDRFYSADHGFDPGYWWENRDGIAFDGKDSLGFYRIDGVDKWCMWHEHEVGQWTLKGDLSHQAGRENLVKVGLDLNYYDIYNAEIQYPQYAFTADPDTTEPWYYCGVFRDFYDRHPYQGAIYVQDKIETEGMIIKPGVRYDFWYPGSEVSTFIDPITWDTTYTTFKAQLSPRLGVAFPVTDKDKLWFNYGLFSQIPELQYLYQRATQGASAYKYYGNPDLDAEKTTHYEVGVAHAFTEKLKLEVSGYFKDIRGLMDMEMRGEPPFEGHQFENADYGDVRGIQMTFDKRYSNFTSGSASYTLQWASGKSSSDRQNYDYDYRNTPIPIRAFPLNWDQRHAISLNFDLRAPEGQHPVLFGRSLPDRWGINLLWEFGSGLPWTPSEDNPTYDPLEPPNQRRMPYTSTIDLKGDKGFSLGPFSYSIVLEIRNLLDKRNVLSVHGDTGEPGGENVEGEYRESRDDPTMVGPRRQVLLGLSLNW